MSRSAGTAVPESLWSELPSDLDTATLLGSSTARPSTPTTTESPLDWLRATAGQWLGFARGLTLAGLTTASSAVAGAGLALLLFLLVTAGLAPPRDTFARPLTLDFSQADLVGEAVFLPGALPVDGLLPSDAQSGARLLAPGQPVDVWLELDVPRGSGQGVAQVVAQLSSLDGRVAAKASRAVLLRTDWWSMGSMGLTPLRMLGLVGGLRRVRVPLFSGYREKKDVPFMAAAVTIKTRSPGWAAEVVSATLKVQLRLGLIRRALYRLRPAPLALLALACVGVAMLLGGGGAALLFLGLLFYSASAAGGVDDEASSSSVSTAEQVSSGSGVSEASSSMLRDLDQEASPASSPHPSAAAAAEKVDQWYDALPGTSAAAAAAGREPGGGAAVGPADSAMGSSEAAAALRRRTGAKPTVWVK